MDKVWTGERLETFVFNENTTEHLHRYAIASGICKNMDVLDIASGEGYGSNLLSLIAKSITGVDISSEAVEDAAKKYKRSNLNFKQGSASQIPLDTNTVDAVVSFETIEHHDKHNEMLAEIKRVLRPNGILIMSSPDKKYYSDLSGHNNPFHVKELYFDEFKKLINSNFKYADFLFQKIVSGSLIIPENKQLDFKEYQGSYDNIQVSEDFAPVYNLCIASENELPGISSSLFDGKDVFNKMIETAVKNKEQEYRNTWSYKIGHFLLSPAKFFKRS